MFNPLTCHPTKGDKTYFFKIDFNSLYYHCVFYLKVSTKHLTQLKTNIPSKLNLRPISKTTSTPNQTKYPILTLAYHRQ